MYFTIGPLFLDPIFAKMGPAMAGCHGGSEAGHGAQDPGDHGREAVGVTDGHCFGSKQMNLTYPLVN